MIARISEFVQPWAEWAKKREVEIILGVAVALISLLSFAIGYITAKEQLKEPIRIEESQTPNTRAKLGTGQANPND